MTRYQHPFSNPDLADGWGSWAGGRSQAHRGLDYPQPSDTPIPAVADGVVVHNLWNGALGWVLVIRHPDGMYSGYSHQIRQSPKAVGAAITRGQIIGNVGTTGSASNGNHLHLTITYTDDGTWNNADIDVTTDPWSFINDRLNAPETPTTPVPEEDPVPEYAVATRSVARPISTTDWTYLHINADLDTALKVGPAIVNTVAQLSIDGLPTGEVLMLRFVKATGTGDPSPVSLGQTDVVGNGGVTFAQVAANVELGTDQRIRLQAKAVSSGVEVSSWNARTLSWN